MDVGDHDRKASRCRLENPIDYFSYGGQGDVGPEDVMPFRQSRHQITGPRIR